MTVLVFVTIVGTLLYLDIRAHRGNPTVTLGDAARWSLIYVSAALLFAVFVALRSGLTHASLFLTGYVIEKALSVDNLMVFAAVFAYFGIPSNFQHRILHYGIVGAVVFRLVFVAIGATALGLLGRPVELVFGIFVAWSVVKMLKSGDEFGEVDHSNRWYIKWTKRVFPVTADASNNVFFNKARQATPILLCAVAIEITDVMFSFDSVPAVISVTRNPVLIYSAMIFAILGLRSMYFVLEAMKRHLVYLGNAVLAVLCFVALKLMLHALLGINVDPFASLAFVIGALGCGVVLSIVAPPKETNA